MASLAVVDDEALVCKRLAQALGKDGYEVETFQEGTAFLERLRERGFDVVLADLRLPDITGMDILRQVRATHRDSEVIIITGHGGIESAIEAIKDGAFHYVTKPVKLAELRSLVKSAAERVAMRQENLRLRKALRGQSGLDAIVGASPSMQEVFALIRKIAPLDCNVLIQGASGTGKALVARALHQLNPRHERPFVSFNCGGFTEELIGSELFGYEKGAFTGAAATKIGLLESAAGGTVFLDEIGEMPLSMQVKLLHVIQERRILRVGGTRPISLDIRVIAATNRDLKQEVQQGTFREDLFFRLNVVGIALPRLAERREDIPLLASHFIEKYSLLFHKPVLGIQPEALRTLEHYDFPGNIRELENIVERAVALCEGQRLGVHDLPQDLQQLDFDTVEGSRLLSMDELERRHIATVLARSGHNKGLAAQILGIPRTTLWRKLKQYGLG